MPSTKIVGLLIIASLAVGAATYLGVVRTDRVVSATSEIQQRCDVEAADPADVQRQSAGKTDKEIVPIVAIRACTEAINNFPSEPRFHYQLGRSLLAMKRKEEAERVFSIARGMGYLPANFYLAETKITSYWATRSESELEDARALLEEAADSFDPAAERLGQITFDANAFSSPVLMQALWDGDFEYLNKARMLVAVYARGLDGSIGMEFHPSGQDCPAYVVDPSIRYGLDRAIAGDPRNTLEGGAYYLAIKAAEVGGTLVFDPVWKGSRDKWSEYYEGLGKRDALFIAHHLGCSSPVTERLYNHLVQFSKQQHPLSEYADGMLRGDAKELFSKPGEEVNAREQF